MSIPAGAPRSDNIARGIVLSIVAILIFGIQDAVTKLLVADHSPFQVTMIRYWAFGIFSFWLVLRQGPLRRAFDSRLPWLQVARAVLLVADIWLFATATQTVPLAELQAMILIYPLLVTLVAIPILGETVGIFRLSAVCAGLVGALIIVRPGIVPFEVGVGYALLAAVCYALYIALTRRVSRVDTTATSMAYMGAIGLVLTSGVGIFFWTPLEGMGLVLMAIIMCTSVAGHWVMIEALTAAPASVVQPFNYLALPWGIFLSIALFGHLIDTIALMGGLVIVLAGLVVMARERYLAVKNGRRAAVQPATAAPPALPPVP
jgi:drug/metabolite transporter (DMT)-like permease